LASSGNKLIFTTSFGYMNPTIKVAAQFPNSVFEHATGYKTAKNVGIYNARFYEGRYLCGVIAGKMTKSNVAGYVAAFPIPEVVQGINAFTQGMRSVNPKAELKVIWTNSWYDPGREREQANTLISQSADILAGKLHPFQGPVKDNSGKERVASGKTMSDDELQKMDFYVEGVQGSLPAK